MSYPHPSLRGNHRWVRWQIVSGVIGLIIFLIILLFFFLPMWRSFPAPRAVTGLTGASGYALPGRH
jgi:hypothetical protein